jgi:hypothetical protein
MAFHDFNHGRKQDDKLINEVIKKGVEYCRQGMPHYDWACGDTQVVVIRYGSTEDLKVIVATKVGYSSTHLSPGDETPVYVRPEPLPTTPFTNNHDYSEEKEIA